MGIATVQGYWEMHALAIAFIILITMLVTFTAIFAPTMANSWGSLTYSDFSGVFDDDHELHNLKFNTNYVDGSPN